MKKRHYNLNEYWISSNKDVIKYKDMDYTYAENLYNYHKRKNMRVPKQLEERYVEYKEKLNKRKNLF